MSRGPVPKPYRSWFEYDVHQVIGNEWKFEAVKIPFVDPRKERRYLPDFIKDNTILETKGRFTAPDRAKMLRVAQQNPDKKIILVFQNPNIPIKKGSKTTIVEWAEKNGFTWTTLEELKRHGG